MSKTLSRKISAPRSNGSLFVPTLLSLALLSAFSSLAIADNSGGFLSEDKSSYGNWTKLTDNNVIIDTSFDGDIYGAFTDANNQIVSDNNVTIKNDTSSIVITGRVSGGFIATAADDESITSSVFSNSVSISKGVTINDFVVGGFAQSVIFVDGLLSADASQNSVEISGATIDGAGDYSGYVYGGRSEAIRVPQETPDGLVGGDVTANVIANNNVVSISDDAVIGNTEEYYGGVFGGYSYIDVASVDALESKGIGNATANNNSVTIASNSEVGDDVSGGYALIFANEGTVSVNTNTMTISDAYVEGDVYGGYAEVSMDGTTSANANIVRISDSYFSEDVISGNVLAEGTVSATAYASDNKLIIDGSKSYVDWSAMAGYIEIDLMNNGTASAYANNNTVVVSGGAEIGEVVVGGSIGDIYDDDYGIELEAGGTANAYANNNSVSVLDSEVNDDVLGAYVNVYTDGETDTTINAYATNNIVNISSSDDIGGNVYGGRIYIDSYSEGNNEVNANSDSNTVLVSSSLVIDDVYGGRTSAFIDYGDGSVTGTANNNDVTVLSSSTLQENVYDGRVAVEGGTTAIARANYNTVAILDGAIIKGSIYGGYADAYGGKSNTEQASYNTVTIDSSKVEGDRIAGGAVYVDAPSDSHTATHNTVNISGSFSLQEAISLYGGYYETNPEDPSAHSLNDDLFTGNTLNLDARQYVTTTVGTVANFETINLRAGKVEDGGTVLATTSTILGNGNDKGTTVNLLSVENSSLQPNSQITLISGVEDNGKLANDGQKQFVPVGESIALGYNGEVALDDTENKVVFNIEGKGTNPKTKVLSESRAAEMAFLNSAADLLQDQDIHKAGKHVFGAVRGIYNKYKTGSSVDISGVGLVTGVANTWAGDSADLTGAVFVEAGWGSFDTKNSISGDVQRGDGDSYYYGTGLIGKYDVTQGLLAGLYAEAAAHVGIISTDYSNGGLSTLNGVKASYDTDSLYYAAHATAGYRWNVTESLDLDVSATYLWNYLESQEVKIAADKFDFDSVQSHRMRLAAEVGYTADKGFRPYAGVAWEREFDGKAGGSVAGYRLDEADLGGNSGLAWAGVSFEPKEGGPIKADAEIKTYFGQRKGVSGRVWLRYEF